MRQCGPSNTQSFTSSSTLSWSSTEGISTTIGFKADVKVAKISASVTLSGSWTQGESKTSTSTVSVTSNCLFENLPEETYVELDCQAKEYTIPVTMYYTQCGTKSSFSATVKSTQLTSQCQCKKSTGCGSKPIKDCVFVTGDGEGGSEKKISADLTGQECMRACFAREGFNGATINADGSGGCWCEKGMSSVSKTSTKYKTCYINNAWNIEDQEFSALEYGEPRLVIPIFAFIGVASFVYYMAKLCSKKRLGFASIPEPQEV